MRTRSSWIWCWIVVAVLASGAGAQQYTTIIDNLPTCTGNRNGRVISVSDAVSDADCTEGGATGEDRFVHQCICDTLNALGPYWKAVGGGAGSSGPADALAPAVVIEGTTFEGNFTFADPTADWTWDWSPTGQSLVPSGTNSLPTYSFAGDPNTGIYSDTADTIKFTVGGSRRLYLNTSGLYPNVGIFGAGDTGHYLEGFLRHVQTSTAGSGAPRATQVYEAQYLFTNEGSTAENYHALPSAVVGYPFAYCAQDADGIRVVAAAGDTIRVIDKVTAAAGYVSSTTIGSCISLQAINATEWFTTAIVGVWTDGTFTYDDTGLTAP